MDSVSKAVNGEEIHFHCLLNILPRNDCCLQEQHRSSELEPSEMALKAVFCICVSCLALDFQLSEVTSHFNISGTKICSQDHYLILGVFSSFLCFKVECVKRNIHSLCQDPLSRAENDGKNLSFPGLVLNP